MNLILYLYGKFQEFLLLDDMAEKTISGDNTLVHKQISRDDSNSLEIHIQHAPWLHSTKSVDDTPSVAQDATDETQFIQVRILIPL